MNKINGQNARIRVTRYETEEMMEWWNDENLKSVSWQRVNWT